MRLAFGIYTERERNRYASKGRYIPFSVVNFVINLLYGYAVGWGRERNIFLRERKKKSGIRWGDFRFFLSKEQRWDELSTENKNRYNEKMQFHSDFLVILSLCLHVKMVGRERTINKTKGE